MATFCLELNLWEKIRGFDTSNISSGFLERHPELNQSLKVSDIELNFKRFFYIIKHKPSLSVAIGSKPIIAYWKDCIIHTKLYEQLCKFGNCGYVHFDPNQNVEGSNFNREYTRLYVELEQNFGKLDPEIWPKPKCDAEDLAEKGEALYDAIKAWADGRIQN